MLFIEDRQLLTAFRRGDQGAFAQVYRHYAPVIAGFLRSGFRFESGGRSSGFRGVRTEFELEDRLHDVFSRAFSESARLSYDGLSPYKSYLFTIARNLIIDDFRKKTNALLDYSFDMADAPAHTTGTATEPTGGLLALSGDPHHDAENAQLLALIEQWKTGLPAREQDVYRLRFVEELEHKDISAKTGLSLSKVKTSEQRIREGFFNFMRRNGYFDGYVNESRGWLRFLRSW